MAQAYNIIKAEDPYHITTAGIVCDSSWLWSDTALSLVTPTADLGTAVIAEAHQPWTQLSLDYREHRNPKPFYLVALEQRSVSIGIILYCCDC